MRIRSYAPRSVSAGRWSPAALAKGDAAGVLSYVVGVRSLDGAGPQTRGVRAEAPATATEGKGALPAFSVSVTNTGTAMSSAPAGHIRAPADAFASDIYRVSVAVDESGAGAAVPSWDAAVRNALVALKPGETAQVPVFTAASSRATTARITVSVVSESDPTKRATTVTTIRR